MTDDPNRELIDRLARRPPETPEEPLVIVPRDADWNVPIDTIQADCMTLRMWVRGRFGELKDAAQNWVPGRMPEDWDG